MGQRRRTARRRSKKGRRRGGGGVLVGMRSGFKGAARAVTGQRPRRGRSSTGIAVTIILVLAAAALVLGRV